jgi:hypothetical protein
VQSQPGVLSWIRNDVIGLYNNFGYLVLMDATHQTNNHDWKLFSLMIRDTTGSWISGAHFLVKSEKLLQA